MQRNVLIGGECKISKEQIISGEYAIVGENYQQFLEQANTNEVLSAIKNIAQISEKKRTA